MSFMLNKKTNRDKFSVSKQGNKGANEDRVNEKSSNQKKLLKSYNNNIAKDPNYEKGYQKYISNSFTMQSYLIITKLINCSISLSPEVKSHTHLHSIMQKIIKQLLMNEVEIVYFSLSLDAHPFNQSNLELQDYLLIIGLNVKKYFNKSTLCIENFLNAEYPDLMEKHTKWSREVKDQLAFSPFDFNEKYNFLKGPSNTYCKNDFIDYNESVDQILQMSLPYKEGNKSNEKNNGKVHKVNFKVLRQKDSDKPVNNASGEVKSPLATSTNQQNQNEKTMKIDMFNELNSHLPNLASTIIMNNNYNTVNITNNNIINDYSLNTKTVPCFTDLNSNNKEQEAKPETTKTNLKKGREKLSLLTANKSDILCPNKQIVQNRGNNSNFISEVNKNHSMIELDKFPMLGSNNLLHSFKHIIPIQIDNNISEHSAFKSYLNNMNNDLTLLVPEKHIYNPLNLNNNEIIELIKNSSEITYREHQSNMRISQMKSNNSKLDDCSSESEGLKNNNLNNQEM